MKLLKEWIDERDGEDINCFDYNKFSNLKKVDNRIHGTLKKANWEDRKITVVLKDLNNSKITESCFEEFIDKLKVFRKINHPNINRFHGLTKDLNGKYFSIWEYSNNGDLRDYLKNKFSTLKWDDKIQMALDITRGLMYLHSEKVIHGNLHGRNVLIKNGIVMMTDLRLFRQITEVTFENIAYVEPQYLHNSRYEQDMKSDIYSLGVLLWELSSGRPPFSNYMQETFDLAQIEKKLLNGEREDPVENTPLEYLRLYQKCWQDDPSLRPEINEVYEILSQFKLQFDTNEQLNTQVEAYDKSFSSTSDDNKSPSHTEINTLEIFKSSLTTQQIISHFKLDHGLILTEYNIRPSIQAVAVEDGELKLNLYKGQPIVYACINSEGNGDNTLDTCINFSVVEIIYKANLLESFLKYSDDEKKLCELYGDFFSRKFLAGGQLFIKDFNLATPTQKDILKFYLFCTYNSAKYSTEIQFNNLYTLNLLPRIETLDGKKLNTHEKLAAWMNNLYQKKMVDMISYINPIPISQLKYSTSLIDDDHLEAFNEKLCGITNFKEKLSLEEWVGDAMNDNLMSWTRDFNLFRGLIVNESDEIELSKKIPINIIGIPRLNSSNKSSLKMIKPLTKFEFTLISNNIYTNENLKALPFIESNAKNYEGFKHIIIQCEQYEIFLNKNSIKPTKEFEHAIENALNSMKPLKALRDVFNEYGHLLPRRFILGRSLKNVLSNLSSFNIDNINLNSPIFDSLKPYLDNLNISYFLTQKGRIIEKNDLPNWIQNTNNHLELIEFDDVDPLYKVLEEEQQRKIDNILKDGFKIIMTGITDLGDLNNNNVEHYKYINLEMSLEDDDYEVFGSIISENNTKLKEIYVNFGLYNYNGFYAIIKKLEETSIDVTKCYVLWMIIGNPIKLSVLSPKNREIQVNCIKDHITLRFDELNYYSIKISFPLFEGYKGNMFAVHAYDLSANYEPNNIIKLIKWKDEFIDVQIIKSTYNESSSNDFNYQHDSLTTIDIELHICVISMNYKNLKIDHKKEVYPLDVIGYILTKENEHNKVLEIESHLKNLSNYIEEDKAFESYRKSAEQECSNAQNKYENSLSTEKYLEKAIYWLQKAAESNNIDAQYNLALLYENGEKTERNLEKAFYWYLKAAENDYKDAMNSLAICYYNGEGTEKNLEKAFYWYQKAVEMGHIDAQFNLAICYQNGEGTEKNLEKAFYWYQKATENNNKNSNINNGSCKECKQPYVDYHWCQQCNAKRFHLDFSKWTSKNEFIDIFIQEAQLNAKNSYEVLEWIPYNKLKNISYYDKGGFSEIHKAVWLDGPIDSWNFDKQQWNRWKSQIGYEVILKNLNNSSNLNNKFLNEWKYHYNCQKKSFSKFIQFFGITQDPNTLNYMIIMSYAKEGSLRKYLPNLVKFKWQHKLQLLKNIILGLRIIHESNLVHCDLHDGNILISDNYETYIIDLGLCKPINDLQDSVNYGVIPYMAPEVLRNKPYTPASDIYSFSMIMWEFTSGIPPFNNRAHDYQLCLSICKGERPEIIENTPKCYIDLMEKCWNSDPFKRPTIIDLENIISQWLKCINEFYELNGEEGESILKVSSNSNIGNKFRNDMYEFVETNKALAQEQANTSIIQFHPQACYSSRLLTEILD